MRAAPTLAADARRRAAGSFAPTTGRTAWGVWVTWLVVLVGLTTLMFTLRARLDRAHVALGFLIAVLGGSAAGGRAVGLTLAILGFLLFNFLFLPPPFTLAITDPFDWLILVAFLTTGVVAAQLLNRAQERAEIARQRAVEVERLAALGAEALSAGRAEDALRGVLDVVRSVLGVACCEILVPAAGWVDRSMLARVGDCAGEQELAPQDADASWSLAAWVTEKRAVAAERADGTKWIGGADQGDDQLQWPPAGIDLRALLVPLIVRERVAGLLRIAHDDAFRLDPGRGQFLSALSYYAALGVERVRLAAEAERAGALREADALKSALIAGLSHDLRTPLTTIKALAHTLRERGSHEAATIEEESDRLNRLVADLLDLSRLNAGALPMRAELNAAEELVGAAVRSTSGALGDGRIIVTAPAGGPAHARPLLMGRFDFVQSLRALVNLIENAGKYSPAGVPVELSVTQRGALLAFTVSDRGPGVAETEQERIFEPFYRTPGAAPETSGAGLGLAIARRLALEQGGDVQYEARRGGGSLFTLLLPAADLPAVPT